MPNLTNDPFHGLEFTYLNIPPKSLLDHSCGILEVEFTCAKKKKKELLFVT